MFFLKFNGISKGDINVIYMSLCFFILFSADIALTNLEKTLISSIQDDNEGFVVNGYNLLSTFFIAFAISIWLAPSIVSVLGVRMTLTLAAVLHTIYAFSFSLEKGWLLYLTSTIAGIGNGLLWTASGKYLVLNSSPGMVSRNIGIFWTFFSSSGLFGNLFVYLKLRGQKYIEKETRLWVIYGLTVITSLAAIAFAFLRPTKINKEPNQETNQTDEKNPLKELKTIWNVFWTKEMLLLCFIFCYTGLQQALAYGIYGPSIGFTLQFGSKAKEFVPISGLLVSVGEIIGGFWQTFHGTRLSKLRWGRKIVILSGVFGQLLSYVLMFVNLPATASFGDTEDKAIIESNVYIALLCSLLLGIGDGCLNTQNYSIIAIIYPNESAHSCALYKFAKAVFVSLGYSLSTRLNLHYLIGSYSIIAVIGVITFIYVDTCAVKIQNDNKCKEEKNIETR